MSAERSSIMTIDIETSRIAVQASKVRDRGSGGSKLTWARS
jgi:hypothetical protein